MQDREIVAAIVAGQPGGLAAAYDRYAQALHAYCCTMLGEPSDAADAVQDTFVTAAAKLGGLRDPSRLRPWLYAVARNECHRWLRGRGMAAPLDDADDMADSAPDIGEAAEKAELRQLVRSALGGLNPGEREIIELNLRHELDGGELAAALGVPRNQAHALASRARTQFETALGALLVARSGLRLTQAAEGGPYTGSFTLTATGGPVKFSITDSLAAGELSIAPASGSLTAGQTVTATLSAPATGGPPSFETPITVDPGSIGITVEYPPSG